MMDTHDTQETREPQGMARRTFIGAAAAALFAGVSLTLFGCGEDDATGPGDGSVAGVIGENHGHSVSISKAQIDEGAGVTLDLTTGNGHTHQVILTTDQVALIKSGAGVHNAVTTTTNSHTHTVMFM
jgi:hypothetical protein